MWRWIRAGLLVLFITMGSLAVWCMAPVVFAPTLTGEPVSVDGVELGMTPEAVKRSSGMPVREYASCEYNRLTYTYSRNEVLFERWGLESDYHAVWISGSSVRQNGRLLISPPFGSELSARQTFGPPAEIGETCTDAYYIHSLRLPDGGQASLVVSVLAPLPWDDTQTFNSNYRSLNLLQMLGAGRVLRIELSRDTPSFIAKHLSTRLE